jgi:hypothetical protein
MVSMVVRILPRVQNSSRFADSAPERLSAPHNDGPAGDGATHDDGDHVETFLKVLEAVSHPDRLVPLLDPDLIIETQRAGSTPRTYDDLIEYLTSMYTAGVRGQVLTTDLAGDRMIVSWKYAVPAGVAVEQPSDGHIVWRMFTLGGGRIVSIQECASEVEAKTALVAR